MKAPARHTLATVILQAFGALAVVASATTAASTSAEAPPSTGSAPSRRVEFTYEAMFLNLPADRNTFDLWVPLPKTDANQKITELVISTPYEINIATEEVNGTQVGHVRSGARGGLPIKITVRFKAERFADLHPDLTRGPAVPPSPPASLDRYLKSDRLVPVDDETRALASKVTRGKTSALDKAKAIYEYVVQYIKYDKAGDGWGQGDFRYAMSVKRGNCTDFNAVFTGLARASRIPARMIFGFKIPRGLTEANLSEYHCWSEFWLDGLGWVPVDPVEGTRSAAMAAGNFGSIDANRIVFSVGRDISLMPPQNGDPLNFFLYPYSEGDGEPLTGSAYKFSYKDDAGKRPPTPAAEPPQAAPAPPARGPGMGRPDPNAPPSPGL